MNIEKLYELYSKSTGISIDTRTILPGNLFFALKGERFDGHKFINLALSKGAIAAIVSEDLGDGKEHFQVENTLFALQELATLHRQKLGIPIVGITGTNGKTTTKELIVSVLSEKFIVGGTKGNFNNQVGVPLTLLSFSKEVEIGVVEMGANHQGDIAELCAIAQPNFGLITNIGTAHLEGFGSFEGVVKTKSELFKYLEKTKATAIFCNKNDELLVELLPKNVDVFSYGKNNADIDGQLDLAEDSLFLNFKWRIREAHWNHVGSQLVGGYNLNNALAAIAVAKYFGLPNKLINHAIENYIPGNKRSQFLHKESNDLILDAYNANPVSMLSAINNLEQIQHSRDKVAILGDMFELGEYSSSEHKKIVDLLTNKNSIHAIFIGEEFYKHKNIYSEFYLNSEQFVERIKKQALTNKLLLLKASRGMKFENLLAYF